MSHLETHSPYICYCLIVRGIKVYTAIVCRPGQDKSILMYVYLYMYKQMYKQMHHLRDCPVPSWLPRRQAKDDVHVRDQQGKHDWKKEKEQREAHFKVSCRAGALPILRIASPLACAGDTGRHDCVAAGNSPKGPRSYSSFASRHLHLVSPPLPPASTRWKRYITKSQQQRITTYDRHQGSPPLPLPVFSALSRFALFPRTSTQSIFFLLFAFLPLRRRARPYKDTPAVPAVTRCPEFGLF